MENNRTQIAGDYDALIIGGGFKGMMSAYGLTKQGLKVCIVDNAPLLGGFMAPLTWQGVDMDKGPQYLDGVNGAQKAILDDIMSDHQPLDSLEFSYASYWNGVITKGFAIPDYRTLDKSQKAQILYEAITDTAATITNSGDQTPQCIGDSFNEQNEVSASYISKWCHKFLNASPFELSPINQNFVTFFGRKLVLDNDLSLDLKQHPLLDDAIAANKKQINHNTYNLYPKGKTLGYFRQAFEHKLGVMGVESKLKSQVTKVLTKAQANDEGYTIMLDVAGQAEQVTARAVYCAGTIESSESLLLSSDTLKAKVQGVSQVFYLIELDSELDLPFYIMNYSDDSLSRVTYFNAYGQKSINGKAIICVEVPAKIGSEIWTTPDKHYPTLVNELARMGISGCGAYQAVPIPSTYRLALKGYEQAYQHLLAQVEQQYGQGVHILTPHLLTRASIMQDLSDAGILTS